MLPRCCFPALLLRGRHFLARRIEFDAVMHSPGRGPPRLSPRAEGLSAPTSAPTVFSYSTPRPRWTHPPSGARCVAQVECMSVLSFRQLFSRAFHSSRDLSNTVISRTLSTKVSVYVASTANTARGANTCHLATLNNFIALNYPIVCGLASVRPHQCTTHACAYGVHCCQQQLLVSAHSP